LLDKLRFPIGKFHMPEIVSRELIDSYIADISVFPELLKKEVAGLSDGQLDTTYRPEGWSIRQIVHHCADSHMNSFIRFKLALTEDSPTIKPYYEERWAELPDSNLKSLEPSLNILGGLHERWVVLLKSMDDDDLTKVFVHPEHGRRIPLLENLGIYAFHGRHHLAHITELKKRKGW